MFSVPLGMTGAQEFIPLMINAVNEGKLTLNQVAQKAAEAPARTFGIYPKKGVIQVGSDADFTIIDMTREGEFRHEDMLSKSAHTSWVGMRTKGAATYGIVRGTTVMRDGKVVGSPGYGQFTPGTAARSISTSAT
jgi:dihydroorotase